MFIQRLLAFTFTTLALTFLVGCAGTATPVEHASRPQWKPLIVGKTLDGWTQKGGKAMYRIENGELIGTSQPNTPNSFLCTTREFTNFILELEFKVAPGLNSGVQIRSQDTASQVEWKGKTYKGAAGRVHGIQVEIDPSARAWSGGLYEEGRRGWLNDLKENEAARKAFKQNEWNRYRIEANRDHITTAINDVPAADLHDPHSKSGFIALQVHGVGKRTNDLEVRFRNIRIMELP